MCVVAIFRSASATTRIIPPDLLGCNGCWAMATTNNNSARPTDFSEPWKFSDVVLVVEEQRFHVHRSMLAIWSPVFETMFTSNFKEKNSEEIPLPGKRASEIKELLRIIYDTSWDNTVFTKDNCYFLLDLCREYQIDSYSEMRGFPGF